MGLLGLINRMCMIKKRTNNKAFTLIELLVVIAIIGILATIAIVALQQARQGARDSKRIADIRQIQTALEMYYNNNSSYPDDIDSQIADANNIYMEIVPTAPTPADGDCSSETNQYVYNPQGGEENTSYTISFCLGSQAGELGYGNNCATPEAIINTGCACGGETSITYQGYNYDIVVIGEQCWFAENLRYLPAVSPLDQGSTSTPHYYVSGYEGTNVADAKEYIHGGAYNMYETYGVLYNWPAVIQNDGHGGGDGVCPAGWHVPTDDEWTQLRNYIIDTTEADSSTVARWLKSCRQNSGANSLDHCSHCLSGETCPASDHPIWAYNDTHYGINALGFNFLPGGRKTTTFNGVSHFGAFWTSSKHSETQAWRLRIHTSSSTISRNQWGYSSGFSLRCLRTD